jgi:uncharacterized protein YukE
MSAPIVTNPDPDSLQGPVDDILQEIQGKTTDLFNGINDILSWVPWPLSELIPVIEQGIEALEQKIKEFWDQVNEFIHERGSSSALTQAGQIWQQQVATPAGNLAGKLSPNIMQAEDDWTGDAANAYKNTIPAQDSALTAIQKIANQIDTSLTNIASAIGSFWTAVYAALAAFVVGLIGAVAACCTVVGIPVGIAAVCGVAGVIIAGITAAVMAITGIINSAKAEQTQLIQQLSDNSNFPSGQWPVSTSDMSDDHGGWQPNS